MFLQRITWAVLLSFYLNIYYTGKLPFDANLSTRQNQQKTLIIFVQCEQRKKRYKKISRMPDPFLPLRHEIGVCVKVDLKSTSENFFDRSMAGSAWSGQMVLSPRENIFLGWDPNSMRAEGYKTQNEHNNMRQGRRSTLLSCKQENPE